MQQPSSLTLRVPAALLPSALSEELSGVPPSEPSSVLGASEISVEPQGLKKRPTRPELDRGSTDAAAGRPATVAANSSAAATACAAPCSSTAGAPNSLLGSSSSAGSAAAKGAEPGSGRADSTIAAHAPAPTQEQPATVQRVGSRRGPSQAGAYAGSGDAADAHLQSPASVSSQGWPSACGSSVLGVSVSSLFSAAAAAAAAVTPAPPAASKTEQLPNDGRSSACSSSIGEYSRSSMPVGGAAEGEGSGHWADSPGSSLVGLGPGAGAADPASPPAGTAQQEPRQARAVQQPVAERHAGASRKAGASQASSRCSSRMGAHQGSTAAAPVKSTGRRPGSAGTLGSQPSLVAPSSRPASPKKQPAR